MSLYVYSIHHKLKLLHTISLEDDPAIIKQIAKDIRSPEGTMPKFDEDNLEDIMITGLRAKLQNKSIQEHLLSTGSNILLIAEKTNIMV